MSDIKKFTGFVAPDGTTHKTEKEAIAHTLEIKVKAALEPFASLTAEGNPGVVYLDSGSSVVFVEDLPKFLFAHRDAIMAAFRQEVRTRAQRADKGAPRKKRTPIDPGKLIGTEPVPGPDVAMDATPVTA